MAEDKMIQGYRDGQADCRKGICNDDHYHADNIYAVGYSTGWSSSEQSGDYGVDKEKPKLFAVIEINQWNDSIVNLRCVKTFPTEKEADSFVGSYDWRVVEIK
jgi:hypothetical protein